MTRVLELDGRRRVTLGSLADPDITRYLAERLEDGTLVLTPAVTIPAAQARFMADPQRVAQLTRAVQERERWVKVDDPELADLLGESE